MILVLIGLLLLLTQTVFLTLKLAGAILWSWLVVLIPFWIALPAILIAIYFAIHFHRGECIETMF